MRIMAVGVCAVLAVTLAPAAHAADTVPFQSVPAADAVTGIDAALRRSHELAGNRAVSFTADAEETYRFFYDTDPATYDVNGVIDDLPSTYVRFYRDGARIRMDSAGKGLYPDFPWEYTVGDLTAKRTVVTGLPLRVSIADLNLPEPGTDLDAHFAEENGYSSWRDSALSADPEAVAFVAQDGATVIWRTKDPFNGRVDMFFTDGVLTRIDAHGDGATDYVRGEQAQPIQPVGKRITYAKARRQGKVLRRMTEASRARHTRTWNTVSAPRGSGIPATWSVSTRYRKAGLFMRASNGTGTFDMSPPRIYFRR